MAEHMHELAGRVMIELSARRAMVSFLALVGVWVGIAMILTGAPNFLETWFSPWSRYAIGGLALIGGLLAVFGNMLGDRSLLGYWAQMIGLTALFLWNVAMFGAYTYAVYRVGFDIVGPGEALSPAATDPGAEPNPATAAGFAYVPMLYFGLSGLSTVPLVTLIRLKQPR